MLNPDAPLVWYSDGRLRLRCPEYLGCRKYWDSGVGQYVFAPKDTVAREMRTNEGLTLLVLPERDPYARGFAERERRHLTSPTPDDRHLMDTHTIRYGASHLRRNAVEHVVTMHFRRDPKPRYSWIMLFEAECAFVRTDILSIGDFAQHEDRWTDVIMSIDLRSAAGPNPDQDQD